jgi:hypothetical protein
MPRNPDSPLNGSSSDPDFRRRRAQWAAKARTTTDAHIRALVEQAPPLTTEQRARLAALLLDPTSPR